jgi:NADH:ubiquinone oxidoreductase subunit 6 (subunit J)
MVLFLFVIMLLGAEHTPGEQNLPWQPAVAILLALVLLGMTGFVLWRTAPSWSAANPAPAALLGSVESVGQLLLRYIFPFEVIGAVAGGDGRRDHHDEGYEMNRMSFLKSCLRILR